MKINKKLIINGVIAIAVYAAVMGLVGAGALSRQMMSLITPICVYVMLAVSLSLVVGFLGELSLGHAAFMSIGAYAGGLFLIGTEEVLPTVVSIPLAFVLSRFTSLPIVPLYFLCQAVDILKCVVGFVMVKRGVWIHNFVTAEK